MNRFHLTLPCNSSERYYPHNGAADYTTKLTNPVDLSGNWEMALTEISFPVNCFNVKHGEVGIRMTHTGIKKTVAFYADRGFYRRAEDLVENLNRRQQEELVKEGFSATASRKWIEITLDERKRLRFVAAAALRNQLSYRVTDALSEISSIPSDEAITSLNYLAQYPMNMSVDPPNVYVYCDVQEHVPVGDAEVPLLRIIDRSTTKKIGNLHQVMVRPLYVPVQKKQFDTIQIKMMTSTGDTVPFDYYGKSHVVLEFRRTPNGLLAVL